MDAFSKSVWKERWSSIATQDIELITQVVTNQRTVHQRLEITGKSVIKIMQMQLIKTYILGFCQEHRLVAIEALPMPVRWYILAWWACLSSAANHAKSKMPCPKKTLNAAELLMERASQSLQRCRLVEDNFDLAYTSQTLRFLHIISTMSRFNKYPWCSSATKTPFAENVQCMYDRNDC